jgi:hypothetical protein
MENGEYHKCRQAHTDEHYLAHNSRWQDGIEHAGPRKSPVAILGSSNCDIVNFYFPVITVNTATSRRKTVRFSAEAAAVSAGLMRCAAAEVQRLPTPHTTRAEVNAFARLISQ